MKNKTTKLISAMLDKNNKAYCFSLVRPNKIISAILVLVFLVNICLPTWAMRDGNYGESFTGSPTADAFFGGAIGGALTDVFIIFGSPFDMFAAGAGSIASNAVGTAMYYGMYETSSEPMNLFGWKMQNILGIKGATVTKGQFWSMAAGVAAGLIGGYIGEAVNSAIEGTVSNAIKQGAKEAAKESVKEAAKESAMKAAEEAIASGVPSEAAMNAVTVGAANQMRQTIIEKIVEALSNVDSKILAKLFQQLGVEGSKDALKEAAAVLVDLAITQASTTVFDVIASIAFEMGWGITLGTSKLIINEVIEEFLVQNGIDRSIAQIVAGTVGSYLNAAVSGGLASVMHSVFGVNISNTGRVLSDAEVNLANEVANAGKQDIEAQDENGSTVKVSAAQLSTMQRAEVYDVEGMALLDDSEMIATVDGKPIKLTVGQIQNAQITDDGKCVFDIDGKSVTVDMNASLEIPQGGATSKVLTVEGIRNAQSSRTVFVAKGVKPIFVSTAALASGVNQQLATYAAKAAIVQDRADWHGVAPRSIATGEVIADKNVFEAMGRSMQNLGAAPLVSGLTQVGVLTLLGYKSYFGRDKDKRFKNAVKMALARGAGSFMGDLTSNFDALGGMVAGTTRIRYAKQDSPGEIDPNHSRADEGYSYGEFSKEVKDKYGVTMDQESQDKGLWGYSKDDGLWVKDVKNIENNTDAAKELQVNPDAFKVFFKADYVNPYGNMPKNSTDRWGYIGKELLNQASSVGIDIGLAALSEYANMKSGYGLEGVLHLVGSSIIGSDIDLFRQDQGKGEIEVAIDKSTGEATYARDFAKEDKQEVQLLDLSKVKLDSDELNSQDIVAIDSNNEVTGVYKHKKVDGQDKYSKDGVNYFNTYDLESMKNVDGSGERIVHLASLGDKQGLGHVVMNSGAISELTLFNIAGGKKENANEHLYLTSNLEGKVPEAKVFKFDSKYENSYKLAPGSVAVINDKGELKTYQKIENYSGVSLYKEDGSDQKFDEKELALKGIKIDNERFGFELGQTFNQKDKEGKAIWQKDVNSSGNLTFTNQQGQTITFQKQLPQDRFIGSQNDPGNFFKAVPQDMWNNFVQASRWGALTLPSGNAVGSTDTWGGYLNGVDNIAGRISMIQSGYSPTQAAASSAGWYLTSQAKSRLLNSWTSAWSNLWLSPEYKSYAAFMPDIEQGLAPEVITARRAREKLVEKKKELKEKLASGADTVVMDDKGELKAYKSIDHSIGTKYVELGSGKAISADELALQGVKVTVNDFNKEINQVGNDTIFARMINRDIGRSLYYGDMTPFVTTGGIVNYSVNRSFDRNYISEATRKALKEYADKQAKKEIDQASEDDIDWKAVGDIFENAPTTAMTSSYSLSMAGAPLASETYTNTVAADAALNYLHDQADEGGNLMVNIDALPGDSDEAKLAVAQKLQDWAEKNKTKVEEGDKTIKEQITALNKAASEDEKIDPTQLIKYWDDGVSPDAAEEAYRPYIREHQKIEAAWLALYDNASTEEVKVMGQINAAKVNKDAGLPAWLPSDGLEKREEVVNALKEIGVTPNGGQPLTFYSKYALSERTNRDNTGRITTTEYYGMNYTPKFEKVTIPGKDIVTVTKEQTTDRAPLPEGAINVIVAMVNDKGGDIAKQEEELVKELVKWYDESPKMDVPLEKLSEEIAVDEDGKRLVKKSVEDWHGKGAVVAYEALWHAGTNPYAKQIIGSVANALHISESEAEDSLAKSGRWQRVCDAFTKMWDAGSKDKMTETTERSTVINGKPYYTTGTAGPVDPKYILHMPVVMKDKEVRTPGVTQEIIKDVGGESTYGRIPITDYHYHGPFGKAITVTEDNSYVSQGKIIPSQEIKRINDGELKRYMSREMLNGTSQDIEKNLNSVAHMYVKDSEVEDDLRKDIKFCQYIVETYIDSHEKVWRDNYDKYTKEKKDLGDEIVDLKLRLENADKDESLNSVPAQYKQSAANNLKSKIKTDIASAETKMKKVDYELTNGFLGGLKGRLASVDEYRKRKKDTGIGFELDSEGRIKGEAIVNLKLGCWKTAHLISTLVPETERQKLKAKGLSEEEISKQIEQEYGQDKAYKLGYDYTWRAWGPMLWQQEGKYWEQAEQLEFNNIGVKKSDGYKFTLPGEVGHVDDTSSNWYKGFVPFRGKNGEYVWAIPAARDTFETIEKIPGYTTAPTGPNFTYDADIYRVGEKGFSPYTNPSYRIIGQDINSGPRVTGSNLAYSENLFKDVNRHGFSQYRERIMNRKDPKYEVGGTYLSKDASDKMDADVEEFYKDPTVKDLTLDKLEEKIKDKYQETKFAQDVKEMDAKELNSYLQAPIGKIQQADFYKYKQLGDRTQVLQTSGFTTTYNPSVDRYRPIFDNFTADTVVSKDRDVTLHYGDKPFKIEKGKTIGQALKEIDKSFDQVKQELTPGEQKSLFRQIAEGAGYDGQARNTTANFYEYSGPKVRKMVNQEINQAASPEDFSYWSSIALTDINGLTFMSEPGSRYPTGIYQNNFDTHYKGFDKLVSSETGIGTGYPMYVDKTTLEKLPTTNYPVPTTEYSKTASKEVIKPIEGLDDANKYVIPKDQDEDLEYKK